MRRTLIVPVAALILVAASILPAASDEGPQAGPTSIAPSELRTVDASGSDDDWQPPGAGSRRFPGVGKLPNAVDAVPGEIVVQYRTGVSAAQQRLVRSRQPVQLLARVPGMRVEHLRVRGGASVDAAIAGLLRDPAVLAAEPNLRLEPYLVPNDPWFGQNSPVVADWQWYLRNRGAAHLISDPGIPYDGALGAAGVDVKATIAWDKQWGSSTVRIAVIDTGVSTSHPDLDAKLVAGRNTTGTGNVSDPNPNPASETHGTHVAGIAAAETNNGYGIAGACPGCMIIPIRFGFTTASEVQAIDWAINNNADIINASFGGTVWSKIERNAIQKAGKNNILFVAAAANNNADNDIPTVKGGQLQSPAFPASYGLPNILTVAATNDEDDYGYFTGCFLNLGKSPKACAFTNVGRTSVDVGAPGTDITSTVPAGWGEHGSSWEFDTYNGTSMAAPLVAGIAGLVKSANLSWSAVKVKHAIMNSVDKPSRLKQYLGGKGDFTVTSGRVNMDKALTGKTKGFKLGDGTIEGAKKIAKTKSGTVVWPTKPNFLVKKPLKKGKNYKLTVSAKNGPIDVSIWGPGTIDLWQLQAGCLGGSGDCTLLGTFTVGKGKTVSKTFKAKKAGMHFLQLTSYYKTKKATGKITIKAV